MLFFKFELILIKFGFFMIFKVTLKSGKSHCTIIVQGRESNFAKNEK